MKTPKLMHALWPHVWIWGAFVVGIAVYGTCLTLKPWYGYTALLRPPEYPVSVDKNGKSANLSSTLFGVGNAPSMAQDAQAFVEFSYIKKPVSGESQAFIKSALTSKDSPYLELVIHARSLPIAQAYLKQVVKHLREVYSARIKDSRSDVETLIAVLDEKIAHETALLKQTQQAGRKLGYSPQLLETNMALERDLLQMRLNRGQLVSSISDQKIYNFQVVEARPIDSHKPVSPRKGLYTAVSVVLTSSLLFFFGVGRKGQAPAPTTAQYEPALMEKRRAG